VAGGDKTYAWPLAVDLGNTLVHTACELGILLGDRWQREPPPSDQNPVAASAVHALK
jgi:hypothetical protein